MTTAGPITYDTFLSLSTDSLYQPEVWPATAANIAVIMAGNYSGLSNNSSIPANTHPIPFPDKGTDANSAISYSDALFRSTTFPSLLPAIRATNAISPLLGELLGDQLVGLATWKFHAKERYQSDWQVKTRIPVLFLGNSADPVTPLVSAFNTSSGFEGSVVLEQRGFGHCTTAQSSLCTMRVKSAYWIEGRVPEVGTVCEVDWEPFKGGRNDLWREFA